MPPTTSRDNVAARILAGDFLVVYNNLLLRIPQSWIDAHPGGSLAILHFVGRDATDEIQAYHSDNTLDIIKRYAIDTVQRTDDDGWEPLVPPIMSGWVRNIGEQAKPQWFNEASAVRPSNLSSSSQILLVEKDSNLLEGPTLSTLLPPPTHLSLKVQSRHSLAYKTLHKRVIDAGLYKTPYLTGYGPEVARYILLGGISALTYSKSWFITSAVFLGLMWHQLVFTAHDLGHMGVTHNWAIDRVLGILIADFIGGLSISWWVENHNVHHLVTNHPSHDPDIEHLPFFAISPLFFNSLWSSYYKRTMIFDSFANFFISVQHKLFYIIMAFGRFNLYMNSYSFLFRKAFDTRRARGAGWSWGLEIVGVVFFWWWYGRLLWGCGSWHIALAYLVVSHVVTSPLHIQIVLSHFSMSTVDLGPTESFPHRQMRTTTDVTCPPALSFLHGGLHLQVTHHLFPRLPRHNLREASVLVKEFARQEGLVYAEFGFVKGNKEVVGVLKAVADQVKLIGIVAEGEVQEMMARVNKKAD